jgi:hypothetical protein
VPAGLLASAGKRHGDSGNTAGNEGAPQHHSII